GRVTSRLTNTTLSRSSNESPLGIRAEQLSTITSPRSPPYGACHAAEAPTRLYGMRSKNRILIQRAKPSRKRSSECIRSVKNVSSFERPKIPCTEPTGKIRASAAMVGARVQLTNDEQKVGGGHDREACWRQSHRAAGSVFR